MDKEQEEIFENYLNLQNKESQKAFLMLFRGKKHQQVLNKRMKSDWDTISLEDDSSVNLTPILHKIHFLINSESNTQSKESQLKIFMRWYSRVAAFLLIPLLTLGVLYFLSDFDAKDKYSWVEVNAPMGSRIRTQLPDGSIVWLNSGSNISYHIPFIKRNVTVNGEAFLDVQTDTLRPFTVYGKHGAIRVLGTRFNVKMWPDEVLTEVVLEEGKVELVLNNCEKTFRMSAGEMLVYNSHEKTLRRREVNPDRYTAWIEGRLMLRGKNMDQLSRELSRWFNVEVIVEDSKLHDYTFRATFEDEKLEDVLRLLKMTSPIEYEIIDNQRDQAGSFSKKKVIMRHQ